MLMLEKKENKLFLSKVLFFFAHRTSLSTSYSFNNLWVKLSPSYSTLSLP